MPLKPSKTMTSDERLSVAMFELFINGQTFRKISLNYNLTLVQTQKRCQRTFRLIARYWLLENQKIDPYPAEQHVLVDCFKDMRSLRKYKKFWLTQAEKFKNRFVVTE
jgi:hypothetical protein